jgi:hypothetical protein
VLVKARFIYQGATSAVKFTPDKVVQHDRRDKLIFFSVWQCVW